MQLLSIPYALYYFLRSSVGPTAPTVFDFSDGIATNLEAGLPPDVESVFEMEERDSDGDYDAPVQDLAGGDPLEIMPSIGATAPLLSERIVKAYVVKYTAFRTSVGGS